MKYWIPVKTCLCFARRQVYKCFPLQPCEKVGHLRIWSATRGVTTVGRLLMPWSMFVIVQLLLYECHFPCFVGNQEYVLHSSLANFYVKRLMHISCSLFLSSINAKFQNYNIFRLQETCLFPCFIYSMQYFLNLSWVNMVLIFLCRLFLAGDLCHGSPEGLYRPVFDADTICLV